MKSALVLHSGGLDSTVALYHTIASGLYEKIETISFDYGSRHSERELACALDIAKRLGLKSHVLSLPFIPANFSSNLLCGQGSVPASKPEDPITMTMVVPFRNGILISVAAGIADSMGLTTLVFGAQAGDSVSFADCGPGFVGRMQDAVQLGTSSRVKMVAPFLSYPKYNVVRIGHRLNVPFELTWSCYRGKEKRCGNCAACSGRADAFKIAEIEDTTIYGG